MLYIAIMLLIMLAFLSYLLSANIFIYPSVFVIFIIGLRYYETRKRKLKKLEEEKYKEFLEKFLKSIFNLSLSECNIKENTQVSDFTIKFNCCQSVSESIQNMVEESDKNILIKINSEFNLNLTHTNIKLFDLYKMVNLNEK